MSRGPGRIERKIAEAFASKPDKGLTVHVLCCHIWNDGFDYAPTHSQRSSVLRAAGKVAKRLGWVRFHRHRHNETFFIHADHSYVAEQQRKKEEGERRQAEFEAQKQ